MNEIDEIRFGGRVRRTLNQGLDDIDAETAERLRAARERALERQRQEPPRAAWLERLLESAGGWSGLWLRVVTPVLALAIAVPLLVYLHDRRSPDALAEIDTQLLSDELPVEAYLDEGFEAWLRKEHGS